MWRNWYTRTLEVRVALPCEFESRHPHIRKPPRIYDFWRFFIVLTLDLILFDRLQT